MALLIYNFIKADKTNKNVKNSSGSIFQKPASLDLKIRTEESFIWSSAVYISNEAGKYYIVVDELNKK